MKFTAQIIDSLTEALGPFGPLILVGTLGVLMILVTIPLILNQRQDPLEKLKKASRSGVVETARQEKAPAHRRAQRETGQICQLP